MDFFLDLNNGFFLNFNNGFFLQDHAPPVPRSRTYTVTGNVKTTFPQIRVMKQNYPGKYTLLITLFYY